MSIFDRFKKKEEAKAENVAKVSSMAKKADGKKTAKKAVKKSEKKAAAPAAGAMKKRVLLHPIVTEKATVSGTYIFAVATDANKQEVKKAVHAMYGVTPKSVRMMNVSGKKVRWNYRAGERSNWKKAIVRLNDGETINVYQGT